MMAKSGVLYTECRHCGARVDARLVQCPECGSCCPGCNASGLKVKSSGRRGTRTAALARSSACGKLLAMHEELGQSLMQAMWELDNLPNDPDEAISRVFAVADDLEAAVHRTRELDAALSS